MAHENLKQASDVKLMPLLRSLPRSLTDEETIYIAQLRIKIRAAKTNAEVRAILDAEGFESEALRGKYDPDVAAAISKIFTPFLN